MELDDLKKTWQQEPNQPRKTTDIMNLIHQQSRSPLASLKKSFRRQMTAIAILMTTVLISNGSQVESVPGHVLLSTYIAFCLFVILALYLNYRLTSRMERMDSDVRTNLESYVTQLQKRLNWQYFGSRMVVLVLILMVEILPLYFQARMLDRWHTVSPEIRFSAYAAYMLIIYFFSRSIKERKFGQHIRHLKELLSSMD